MRESQASFVEEMGTANVLEFYFASKNDVRIPRVRYRCEGKCDLQISNHSEFQLNRRIAKLHEYKFTHLAWRILRTGWLPYDLLHAGVPHPGGDAVFLLCELGPEEFSNHFILCRGECCKHAQIQTNIESHLVCCNSSFTVYIQLMTSLSIPNVNYQSIIKRVICSTTDINDCLYTTRKVSVHLICF